MVKLGVCVSSERPVLVTEESGTLREVMLNVDSVSVEDTIEAIVSGTGTTGLLNEKELGGEVGTVGDHSLNWLPPIPRPGKILCVGLNYANHAIETGKTPPPEPLIFSKLGTCLRGCGDDIILPQVTQMVDFEAELVVVIGSKD